MELFIRSDWQVEPDHDAPRPYRYTLMVRQGFQERTISNGFYITAWPPGDLQGECPLLDILLIQGAYFLRTLKLTLLTAGLSD